jgi:hypothetical protein
MMTKNDIKAALDKYKSERSQWMVGMFAIPVDHVTAPFCRDLEYFFDTTLADYPESNYLLPEHIEYLKNMLMKEVKANPANSAAFDLYKTIYNLVNSKSEIAILR